MNITKEILFKEFEIDCDIFVTPLNLFFLDIYELVIIIMRRVCYASWIRETLCYSTLKIITISM